MSAKLFSSRGASIRANPIAPMTGSSAWSRDHTSSYSHASAGAAGIRGATSSTNSAMAAAMTAPMIFRNRLMHVVQLSTIARPPAARHGQAAMRCSMTSHDETVHDDELANQLRAATDEINAKSPPPRSTTEVILFGQL